MGDALLELKTSILAYDFVRSRDLAEKAIGEGVDPMDAADVAIEAIQQIGDKYGRGEAWLPDLMAGAKAMTSAMAIIEDQLTKRGQKRESVGTIIIGTVFGDIHSIGKDMVATLARAEGFYVIDLGVNVKSEVFVEAIGEQKAQILALSALLTTTASEQEKTIKMIQDKGLREQVKIAVGGGAITAVFAKKIGADGYEPTAPLAVKLFRKFLEEGR